MSGLTVRPLRADDLADADRINRIAFGTFFGLEDPSKFRGDGQSIPGRFLANPDGAFGAELDGELVACGFVMDWGSVGILGPLTVDVDRWGKGIGHAMMDEMVGWMDRRGFALQGLFTHPQSPTHIRLYESYGYRMQRITGVMAKEVPADAGFPDGAGLYSDVPASDREAVLSACRDVTDSIYPGLDLAREITTIGEKRLGDTLLVRRDGQIVAVACCHQGAGTEAGSAQALVKVAAVRSGPEAAADFDCLLAAVEAFAASRGVTRLVAGTNAGRAECYEAMLAAGFKTWMNGVAMHRPAGDGYNRPGVFAIDDWR
jgi:GNAT superfamily N-acetyltransferase